MEDFKGTKESFLIKVQGDKGKCCPTYSYELRETRSQNRHLSGWSVMLENKQFKGLTEYSTH
jgi:hypothetical protein